ncbi:MAG: aldehyde dehydrogenase, partial [Alphaproteobacteria bacterium]|nr:aldehyde dehydrogenase [Alphaproteobacteria bacterium]
MSDLLTRDEYRSIADKLVLPNNAFINGRFTAARAGKRFETSNPATGKTLAEIALCDASDVDTAV